MLITIFVALSIAWQAPAPLVNRDALDFADTVHEQEARQNALERARSLDADRARERLFEMKFNDVARAMADFGQTWNRSHKVDASKAVKLKKAWRDLEKVDPWFNTSADK